MIGYVLRDHSAQRPQLPARASPAVAAVVVRTNELHSRPTYHGAFVAAWVGIPSILLVLMWGPFQGAGCRQIAAVEPASRYDRGPRSAKSACCSARYWSVAAGNLFNEPSLTVQEAAERYQRWQTIARYAMAVAALSVALLGPLSPAPASALIPGTPRHLGR